MDILLSNYNRSEYAVKVYGNNVNFVGTDIPIVFTVIGGDNAWGTELMIHDGTVIESGSATKKYSIKNLYVVSASEANKISVVEFLYGTAGTAITPIVTDDSDDDFEKASHGLIAGDKVIINTVATTTGINAYTVYYKLDGSDANHFQLALTLAGTPVVLGGGDGTASISKLTQTSLTKTCIRMAATTSNSIPFVIESPRIGCNQKLFVRAKSETGSTVSIGFLLGVTTYPA